MKFEEALNEQEEGATATPDVRGVAGRFGGGPVRRRVFTRAINIAKPYRKKKKKKSKLSPEKTVKGSVAIGENVLVLAGFNLGKLEEISEPSEFAKAETGWEEHPFIARAGKQRRYKKFKKGESPYGILDPREIVKLVRDYLDDINIVGIKREKLRDIITKKYPAITSRQASNAIREILFKTST